MDIGEQMFGGYGVMAPPLRLRSGEALGRDDRATQHRNISHLGANEVEAFAGERGGSLAVPRKPSFWRSQGRLLNAEEER